MKVGDKVRIIREIEEDPDEAFSNYGLSIGSEGVVLDTVPDENYMRPICVDFGEAIPNPLSCSREELEVVSD